MATRIHRITLFKLPDPENQQKFLEAVKVMAKHQAKDGKPYIPYICAGQALPDDRSKGYTVALKMEFETLEHLRYYDENCAAHAGLKKTGSGLGITEQPTSIYFEGQPTISK